jgi:hypothetical protein
MALASLAPGAAQLALAETQSRPDRDERTCSGRPIGAGTVAARGLARRDWPTAPAPRSTRGPDIVGFVALLRRWPTHQAALTHRLWSSGDPLLPSSAPSARPPARPSCFLPSPPESVAHARWTDGGTLLPETIVDHARLPSVRRPSRLI